VWRVVADVCPIVADGPATELAVGVSIVAVFMLLLLPLLIEVDGLELTVSELEGRLGVSPVVGDVVEYVFALESELERLVVDNDDVEDEDEGEDEDEDEDVSIVDEVFDGKVVHLMVVLMITVCQRQSKWSWRYD
jgi:hypothetical protein